MATTHGTGKANVVAANKPDFRATPKAMSNAHVGKAKPQTISSGKMLDTSKVTLGTTHGNHNVAHPTN